MRDDLWLDMMSFRVNLAVMGKGQGVEEDGG